jgi:hypothetical protein
MKYHFAQGNLSVIKMAQLRMFVQYLTADALVASIEGNEETKSAEQQLRDFIRKHVYHFVLVGEQRDPSDEEDGLASKKRT